VGTLTGSNVTTVAKADISDVALGMTQGCILSNGKPTCWGRIGGRDVTRRLLDLRSEPRRSSSRRKRELRGRPTSKIDKLAVGLFRYVTGVKTSACARTVLGAIECSPGAAAPPASFDASDVEELAIGGWVGCARRKSGSIECWSAPTTGSPPGNAPPSVTVIEGGVPIFLAPPMAAQPPSFWGWQRRASAVEASPLRS
jgi:hypothetical protein